MITKEDIEKFYADVARLGIKHPVAVISDKTGYSKGNVSSYLNKKLSPSEQFINKFYESFKKELEGISLDFKVDRGKEREKQTDNYYQAKYLEQVELRLKDLERDKQFLQRMLELNLGKASAMIQTVLKLQMGHDEVVMKSLDRLEKRPEGTLAAEADSLEMEIDLRLQNLSDTDKKVISNK